MIIIFLIIFLHAFLSVLKIFFNNYLTLSPSEWSYLSQRTYGHLSIIIYETSCSILKQVAPFIYFILAQYLFFNFISFIAWQYLHIIILAILFSFAWYIDLFHCTHLHALLSLHSLSYLSYREKSITFYPIYFFLSLN